MSTARIDHRPPIGWPLAVFVVATFVASGLLLLLQSTIGLDPIVLVLAQFGPAVGAIVTALVFREQVALFAPRAAPKQQFVAHGVLALVACALFWVLFWAVGAALGGQADGQATSAFFVVLLVTQLVGAAGEELGWRGLMQPLLESRVSRFGACVVTGLVWGLWHVQVLANPLVAVVFVVGTVALSVLMGYLGTGAWWQRWIVATVIHWLVNIAALVMVGYQTGALETSLAMTISAVVVAAVFLVMFRIASRRRAARAASAL